MRVLLFLLGLVQIGQTGFSDDDVPLVLDDFFTADEYVKSQARFWIQVYRNLSENEGVLHDPQYPDLVFRRVQVPGGFGRSGRSAVESALDSLRSELRSLNRSGDSAQSPEKAALRAMIPAHWDSTAIELCAQRVRFQRGMRERFRQGLERSYRYLPEIETLFSARGVPDRLKYLPHVESSFHPHAYSKVGAAGMWQFMKTTGRKYMKVGYHVDERRDPMTSSAAAAEMLHRNFEILKSWPLAVMAYNHGPGGVARAVQTTGSTDMGTLLQSYYSATFGFASRNFYAEFLAASTLSLLADSLFPGLDKWEPLPSQTLILPQQIRAQTLSQWTGLSLSELEEFNLALRPAVFRGGASLPKGYALRLPLNADTIALSMRLAAVSKVSLAAGIPLVASQAEKPKDKTETPRLASGATIPPKRGNVMKSADVPVLAPVAPHGVVDSGFSLEIADWEEVAHPWDRFDPSVYNLEYQYAEGILTVHVGPEETISHFSDWSGLKAAEIRGENSGMRGRSGFRMGREVRLTLDSLTADIFLKRREEYFRGMEEDFYARYYVGSLESLKVIEGMNVWSLAQEREIPYWLFLKHNKGRSLEKLGLGNMLFLPVVEEGRRRWGFARYANGREYLSGVRRFLMDTSFRAPEESTP